MLGWHFRWYYRNILDYNNRRSHLSTRILRHQNCRAYIGFPSKWKLSHLQPDNIWLQLWNSLSSNTTKQSCRLRLHWDCILLDSCLYSFKPKLHHWVRMCTSCFRSWCMLWWHIGHKHRAVGVFFNGYSHLPNRYLQRRTDWIYRRFPIAGGNSDVQSGIHRSVQRYVHISSSIFIDWSTCSHLYWTNLLLSNLFILRPKLFDWIYLRLL